MAYSRSLETGTYIWSDSENIHFDDVEIPSNKIDIFLAKLYKDRYDEFQQRIENGNKLIQNHMKNMKDLEG